MTLGEKLVKARTARGLTQAQVAGTQITRNMLSQLEHDTASPSLKTLEYLAQVLQVPISWLLDEPFPSANTQLDEAQSLFRQKQFKECLSLLQQDALQLTEEISLIYLRCCLFLSETALGEGDLKTAQSLAAEALSQAQTCLYASSEDLTEAQMLLVRCKLYTKEDAAEELQCLNKYYKAMGTEEARHLIYARVHLSAFNTQAAERELWAMSDLTPEAKGEYLLLRGIVEHQKVRSSDAMLYFRQAEQEPLSKLQQAELYEWMEQCCKEADDFKGAYQYASKRLALLSLRE